MILAVMALGKRFSVLNALIENGDFTVNRGDAVYLVSFS